MAAEWYVHQGVWVLTYNTESTVDGFVSLTRGSKSAVGGREGEGGRGVTGGYDEMARRRIRRGVGEGEGRGDPGRRRGWWNRKPPPRGSLVPRSTISRQHNSSPLVHSPQPSGTAETSTLILLAGSLPPFSPLPRSLARPLSSLFPCPCRRAPDRLSCPLPAPTSSLGPHLTRARQASSSYTSVPPALFQ